MEFAGSNYPVEEEGGNTPAQAPASSHGTRCLFETENSIPSFSLYLLQGRWCSLTGVIHGGSAGVPPRPRVTDPLQGPPTAALLTLIFHRVGIYTAQQPLCAQPATLLLGKDSSGAQHTEPSGSL